MVGKVSEDQAQRRSPVGVSLDASQVEPVSEFGSAWPAQYRLQRRLVDELRNVAGGDVPVTAPLLTDAGSDPQP